MKNDQKAIVLVMGILITAATAGLIHTVFGLLSKEPPSILVNGPPINFTADQQDIDIQIDPSDPLPANGTVTISTVNTTDSDMNGYPPIGVSVIITNGTVTVTNHTVDIATALDDEAAQQAIESNDDDSNSDGSSNDES